MTKRPTSKPAIPAAPIARPLDLGKVGGGKGLPDMPMNHHRHVTRIARRGRR